MPNANVKFFLKNKTSRESLDNPTGAIVGTVAPLPSPLPFPFMCGAAQAVCYQTLIGPQQQQQNGTALQWASEEMKGDHELCMAAAAQDWHAFEYVGLVMRNDLDVILAAFENADDPNRWNVPVCKSNLFGMVPEEMQQNDRVRRSAGK